MYRPSELIAKQRRYFASIVEWPRDDRAVLWIVSLLVTLEAFDWRPAVLTVDTPILDAALAALWWFPAAPLVGIATGWRRCGLIASPSDWLCGSLPEASPNAGHEHLGARSRET